MPIKDLSGQRFGRLTVQSLEGFSPRKCAIWQCICDCGRVVKRVGKHLGRSPRASCGCWGKEISGARFKSPEFAAHRIRGATKHGHKRTRARSSEYLAWLSIKSRCQKENHKDYPYWGGKGITVCDRWNASFEAFLSDMGKKPSPNHSIDRLDPSGPYSPENCRWATRKEQGERKRSNVPVKVNGTVFPSLAAACRHFGVSTSAANMRIRSGVEPYLAVSIRERMKPRSSRRKRFPKVHPTV